jgi:dethiobiotin synthetase
MISQEDGMAGGNSRGLFITATDTGVGKTFVSALLIKALHERGVDAGYLKPLATGAAGTDDHPICEDVEFVRSYAGVSGSTYDLCPILLQHPLSPYAAARMQGIEVDLDKVMAAFAQTSRRHDFLVVEGVGGLLVPLTRQCTMLDLVKMLALPVLVVCRPGLGTINHSLLTLYALKSAGASIRGFVTNGEANPADPSITSNPEIIQEFSEIPFLGHIPYCPNLGSHFPRWTDYLVGVVTHFFP